MRLFTITKMQTKGINIPVVIGAMSYGTCNRFWFVGFTDTREAIIAKFVSAYGDIGRTKPVIILCEAAAAGYSDADRCFIGWSL